MLDKRAQVLNINNESIYGAFGALANPRPMTPSDIRQTSHISTHGPCAGILICRNVLPLVSWCGGGAEIPNMSRSMRARGEGSCF